MSVTADALDRARREIERSSDVLFVSFEPGLDTPSCRFPLYSILLPQDAKMLRLIEDVNGDVLMAELKYRGRWRPIVQVWQQTKSIDEDPAFAKAFDLGLFYPYLILNNVKEVKVNE